MSLPRATVKCQAGSTSNSAAKRALLWTLMKPSAKAKSKTAIKSIGVCELSYLLPIIERENALLAGKPNRIFIGGFSQGCGMALHCLYSTKIEFAGVVGVSGYLFPITPFDKNNPTPKVIVYGLADVLRPWEYVKVTYQDKIDSKQIVLIEGMEHEVKKKETNEAIAAFLRTTKNSLMQ